jgi:DNA-binding transcriptional LysR family regulator
MAKSEPDWDLFRTFLAVVNDGSFSGAARRLGLAQPTAGRQIEALEAALGARLFTRSRRGLVPTAAALAIVPHVRAMASASTAANRISSAEGHDEQGTVRVTASELISHELLPSILADFGCRYPRIRLEVVASNRNEDVLRGEADIAVRMARPTQTALLVRRIGMVEIGLFAHKRYVEAFGVPDSIEQFDQHRFIGFDRDAHPIHSAGGAAARLRREHFGFRCDSAPVQSAAMRAGAGIGGYHLLLARRDPNLVPVLERDLKFKREMWLVMHRDLKTTRRCKLLFEHLGRALSRYVRGEWVP